MNRLALILALYLLAMPALAGDSMLGRLQKQSAALAGALRLTEQELDQLTEQLGAQTQRLAAQQQLLQQQEAQSRVLLRQVLRDGDRGPHGWLHVLRAPNLQLQNAEQQLLRGAALRRLNTLQQQGRQTLAAMAATRQQLARQQAARQDAQTRQEAQRRALRQQVAERQAHLQQISLRDQELRTARDRAQVASQASSVTGLLEKLPRAPTRATGGWIQPVLGQQLYGYGDPDPQGNRREGIGWRAAAGRAVVAPASGTVKFAGPFKGYGTLLIIDHGGGRHSLLAGLGTVTAQPGQPIQGGEPVGTAGDQPVYFERRQDGKPVAP